MVMPILSPALPKIAARIGIFCKFRHVADLLASLPAGYKSHNLPATAAHEANLAVNFQVASLINRI